MMVCWLRQQVPRLPPARPVPRPSSRRSPWRWSTLAAAVEEVGLCRCEVAMMIRWHGLATVATPGPCTHTATVSAPWQHSVSSPTVYQLPPVHTLARQRSHNDPRLRAPWCVAPSVPQAVAFELLVWASSRVHWLASVTLSSSRASTNRQSSTEQRSRHTPFLAPWHEVMTSEHVVVTGSGGRMPTLASTHACSRQR